MAPVTFIQADFGGDLIAHSDGTEMAITRQTDNERVFQTPVEEDTDERLFIDFDAEVVLVGSWRSGISCYRMNGEKLWESLELNECDTWPTGM